MPWFVGALEIDLGTVALTLAVGAAVLAALSAATDRLPGTRFDVLALHGQNLVGILLLTFVWHLAGGTRNPLPLVPFLLPVLALAALGRRRDVLLLASASIVLVSGVAVCDSPELRWYLLQVGLPLDTVFRSLPVELPGRGDPFPSASMTPSGEAVVLELFAVLLVSAALLARSVSSRRAELVERLSLSRDPESRSVFQSALRSSSVPSALIVAESAEILDVSRSFANQMLLPSGGAGGRTLFDVVSFRDRPGVERLLARGSGELPFAAYSVGAESRVARLLAQRVGHAGREYVLVSLVDRDELFHVWRAFEAADEGLLLVAGETLVASNEAASRLLGDLHFGMDVGPLLASASAPSRFWWREIPASGMAIELSGRKLLARSRSVPSPGEPPALLLVLTSERAGS